jgi:hypothetical protein
MLLPQEIIKARNQARFKLINTTEDPIYFNLFDSVTLSTVPEVEDVVTPANSFSTSFTPPTAGTLNVGVATNNNRLVLSSAASNDVYVYNTSYTLLATIAVGSNTAQMAYNPSNNRMYVASFGSAQLHVIDCTSNALVTSVALAAQGGGLCYNSTNNSVYITIPSTNQVQVVDCSTNTVTSSISTDNDPRSVVFIPSSNNVYVGCNNIGLGKIICSTNTYSSTTATFSDEPISMSFNFENGLIYIVRTGGVYEVTLFDVSTESLVSSVSIPNLNGNGLVGGFLNSLSQTFYVVPQVIGAFTEKVYLIDCYTNLLTLGVDVPVTANTIGIVSNVSFNTNSRRAYIGTAIDGDVYEFTTVSITNTPLVVAGTSGYNAFIQNILNEPVLVRGIRIKTETEEQMDNEWNIVHKDSTGQIYGFQRFPMLDISAYQEQGDITNVKFKNGLILDGRTYFENYKIDPFTSVSLVLYYEQYNLSNFDGKHLYKKPLLYGMISGNGLNAVFHNEVNNKEEVLD